MRPHVFKQKVSRRRPCMLSPVLQPRRITSFLLRLALLALGLPVCDAFVTQRSSRHRDCVPCHGIAEWREQQTSMMIADIDKAQSSKCELFVLPFNADEVLLPGQSMSLVLKEGRFYDLMQDVMDDHYSILGMALMGADGLLPTVVLTEVTEFEVNAGFRGKVTVQVTLRAVGRLRIQEMTQMKPVMMVTGNELVDDYTNNADIDDAPISLVNDVQSTVSALGRREDFENSRTLIQELIEDEVATASWAALATVRTFKSRVASEALACTCAVARLRLTLRWLLEERLSTSNVKEHTPSTDTESGEFC